MLDRLNAWVRQRVQTARIPEPEVMATEEEAECYAREAEQHRLDDADADVIEWVRLLGPVDTVIDVATGPGQIPIKLACHDRDVRVVGVDRSAAMLEVARWRARNAGVSDRVTFVLADAAQIPLRSACAGLVLCNSALHHFSDPVGVFDEFARLAGPRGAVFVRDLTRPPRWLYGMYTGHFGRRYTGLARALYDSSVRASYTRRELGALVAGSKLAGARVFRCDVSHIAVEKRT